MDGLGRLELLEKSKVPSSWLAVGFLFVLSDPESEFILGPVLYVLRD